MALPTEILLPMGGHINPRYEFIAVGSLVVALPTLCTVRRLSGSFKARVGFMFNRGVVTDGTFERCMRRKRLRPGNAGMTGGAFTRNDRRFRRMRIMTGYALLHWIVSDDIDLWITSRLGRIVNMAKRAMFPVSRNKRFDLPTAFSMGKARAVTGLATHGLVIGQAFRSLNIIVTFDTDLVSGIFHLVRGN